MLENLEKVKQSFEEAISEQHYSESYDKEKYILEDGELLSIQPPRAYMNGEVVNGIAIIGDPHAWSKRPGRRLDDSFIDTVIDKLEQIVEHCNENNFLPLILGDLFERANDNNIAMLNKLARTLMKFKFTPITAEGNHDKDEIHLTDHNPLTLFETVNVLEITKDNGFAYEVNLLGSDNTIKKVLIGATPYGASIPDNVLNLAKQMPCYFEQKKGRKGKVFTPLTEAQQKKIEEQEKANKMSGNVPIYRDNKFFEKDFEALNEFKQSQGIEEILWVTHHDLAMNGAYPNSIPLKEILGVDRVLNGHIHGCKESVKVGSTVYYNKGNITRLKIDQINDKPAIWIYDLRDSEEESSITAEKVRALKPLYLNVADGRAVFRLKHNEGEDSVSVEEIDQMVKNAKEKIFVEMLEQKDHDEKTDDAAFIEESLAKFLEEEEVSDELKAMMIALFERTKNNS